MKYQTLQSGMLAFEIDHLSKEDRINEYILTALRTIWGIDTKWLEKQYNFSLLLLHSENLKSFKEQGMIQIEEGMITLSDKTVASRTQSLSVRQKILYVKISSGPLKKEIMMNKTKVLTLIAEKYGKGVINDLVIL